MTADSEQPRAWQRMLSGRRLDLLHPMPDDIEIEDIAHGLARVARWNGQTEGASIFSVAQHSVLVERFAVTLRPDLGPAERLAVLLHDAPEYVIGDMISPFKSVLGGVYKDIEHRLLRAIHARFSVPDPSESLAALIKQADKASAFHEAVKLAGFEAPEAASIFGTPEESLLTNPDALTPLRSHDAQRAFMARFNALQAARRDTAFTQPTPEGR